MSFQEYASTEQPSTQRLRARFGRLSKPVLAGAVALGILCVGIVAFHLSSLSDGFEIEKADASVEAMTDSEAALPSGEVYVHVAGCVARPGICKLEEGARVAEAIEAAGGFTEDAATESVNLARVVEDGEQIVVASTLEMAPPSVSGAAPGEAAQGASTASGGRININTASEADLQTLSGIGPSKAQKIIAYRESNGSFKTVEDLCNVSGIGQKTLESIRDQICVG